ncbi:UDP-N-acetylglucosamine 2-epimerase (non-hydrolyzing) [Mangrovibacillus sp. Mu-81]|uniref:non-hydrolyzing UDP-N-acetylglucosamine 2-epimerase n=1 Tax=Mangrovibacillus sp. Mu-81 TaxID=3121478 RepID=UPI002FE4C6A8
MVKKIVTVIGTRPQFVKAAAVSRELRNQFNEILINTGQHYDHNMSSVFFEELKIPLPDYNLEVGSGSHGKQTGEMLALIEEVLMKEKPDGVLVYGDTNSTTAGALAASKLHIPIFHVEAGLRSFNRLMPEEINRVLTDHLSSLLFSPTTLSVGNLRKEGITRGVYNVGDIMYDAVLFNGKLSKDSFNLEEHGLKPKEFILSTIHRAENTDDNERLAAIFKALMSIEQKVLLPLHPRTKKKLTDIGLLREVEEAQNILLLDPLSYLEMLYLEKNANYIVTDSGGVQKEAYFMQVPCITLRNETEWVETVEAGWNVLVDPIKTDLKKVIKTFSPENYIDNLYGDGQAGKKMVRTMVDYLNEI